MISLRVSINNLQDSLILIMNFKKNVSTLEPEFYKNFMKSILKVYTWNRIKRF